MEEETSTHVPTLSPVPSGTEVLQRCREEPPRFSFGGRHLPAHVLQTGPHCKGTGDPNSQWWSSGSPGHTKELRWHMRYLLNWPREQETGTGRGLGRRETGHGREPSLPAWEDFVTVSGQWVEFAGHKHKLKHAQRE